MTRVDDMALLVEVVDRGGFSGAAPRLGLSKQQVSKRVGQIEARLGARLLARTTRRLTLTELGRDYVERARQILRDIDDAEQAVSSHGASPRGRLRVSAPVSFSTLHLSPLIASFIERYPAVEVELDLNGRAVDLIAEGYDMAVRIGVLTSSTLIARKLADLRLVICASPEYLTRHGTPQSAADLSGHACLLYGHDWRVHWPLRVNGVDQMLTVSGPFRSNNGELVHAAALRHLGLAQLPDFIVGRSLRRGDLVTVLDDLAPAAGGAYVVHPAHRQRSPSVRALIEHLSEMLSGSRLDPW